MQLGTGFKTNGVEMNLDQAVFAFKEVNKFKSFEKLKNNEIKMKILGINYGGHDTSASIIIDGNLVAACEEERYDKIKHSRNFL